MNSALCYALKLKPNVPNSYALVLNTRMAAWVASCLYSATPAIMMTSVGADGCKNSCNYFTVVLRPG